MTQLRPLGGRMVPVDFLPEPRIKIGCLNDVVVLKDEKVPDCRSGKIRVTAGDVLNASFCVSPTGLSASESGCVMAGEKTISGAGVVGPDALARCGRGVVCENMELFSGKGSCSAGESWLISPGSCNPEVLR